MSSYKDFMSDDEIAQVRRPLEEASFLPPRLYHDEKFYDFEIDKIFMRTWIPVAHVSELAEPGSYVARTMFGEPLMVTRNAAGEINAFSAVCRHRTSTVATGTGKFNEKTGLVHCPYHGWGYSSDGSLVSAPVMNKTKDFDKGKCGLPKIACEVWEGFVFINFASDPEPLGPQLKTLTDVVAPFKMAELACVDFAEYDVAWNWKVTLENFTEGYHQVMVHGTTIEPFIPSKLQTYDDVDGPYNLFYMPTLSKEPLINFLPPIPGLPQELMEKMVVINVFPLFHLLMDATSIYWLDWVPRSAADHGIRWRLLAPRSTVEAPEFEPLKGALLTILKAVWAEDTAACDGVNAGVRSRYAAIGRPAYMEKAVHQFQNWLVDQYTR